MLRDPDRALMLPPYIYKEQVQPSEEWLDAVVQLATQYDGKDCWYSRRSALERAGERCAAPRLKSQSSARSNPAFNQLVWGLRPRTALPDLITAINGSSTPIAERTVALYTLGWMQWPEAARALEAFITSSSTPPVLAERAFGLYSHQLFGMWMDARTSPALPGVMRKGFAASETQSAAVALADALGDTQYLPDLVGLASPALAAPMREQLLSNQSPPGATRATFQICKPSRETAILPASPRFARLAHLACRTSNRGRRRLDSATCPTKFVSRQCACWRSVAGLTAILDLAEKGSIPPELHALARNLTNYASPPSRGGRRGAPQSPVAMRAGRGAAPTILVYIAIRERAASLCRCRPQEEFPLRSSSI